MDKDKVALVIAVILLIVVNYSFLDNLIISLLEERDFAEVERVIDGDTIIANNESVRLLGINTPEKGELYYEEAKEFLEGLLSNQTVGLEYGIPRYDKYQRTLAFVFIGNTNINVELVEWGLANVYILEDKTYEKELRNAWEECLEKNINLCEKSENVCAECINVKSFEKQIVTLENTCNFNCSLNNWTIKDEGRKKFVFEDFVLNAKANVEITAEDFGEDYVWTKTGDTLFLRDGVGKLVLWKRY